MKAIAPCVIRTNKKRLDIAMTGQDKDKTSIIKKQAIKE
jgi:hypothetical protein